MRSHILPRLLTIFSYTISFTAAKPQGSSSSSDDQPDPSEKACLPKGAIFIYGTQEEREAAGYTGILYNTTQMIEGFKDSKFPCEQYQYIIQACTDYEYGIGEGRPSAGAEVVEAERACLCPSRLFELAEACAVCQGMNGYTSWDPQYVPKQVTFWKLMEKGFCNTTIPRLEWHYFEKSVADAMGYNAPKGPGRPITADPSTGKTEIGLYYTEGVRASETQISVTETASVDAVGDGPPQSNTQPFTRASTFGTTPKTTFGGAPAPSNVRGGGGGGDGRGAATSTAGARELKAAGGVVAAIFGALVML